MTKAVRTEAVRTDWAASSVDVGFWLREGRFTREAISA